MISSQPTTTATSGPTGHLVGCLTAEEPELAEKVRQIIAGLPEAAVVHQHGVIVEGNQFVPEILGCPPEALRGRHLKEFVTEDSLFRLAHCLDPDYTEPALLVAVRPDGRTVGLQVRNIGQVQIHDHLALVLSVRLDAGEPLERVSAPTPDRRPAMSGG